MKQTLETPGLEDDDIKAYIEDDSLVLEHTVDKGEKGSNTQIQRIPRDKFEDSMKHHEMRLSDVEEQLKKCEQEMENNDVPKLTRAEKNFQEKLQKVMSHRRYKNAKQQRAQLEPRAKTQRAYVELFKKARDALE